MGRFAAFALIEIDGPLCGPRSYYTMFGSFGAFGLNIKWWFALRPLAQNKLMGRFAAFGAKQTDGPICGPWIYYTMVGRIPNLMAALRPLS